MEVSFTNKNTRIESSADRAAPRNASKSATPIQDNRNEQAAQRATIQRMCKDCEEEEGTAQRQVASASASDEVIQQKANKTGMPENLKSGLESLSGMDMSDVRVHYNSPKPAQLNAHAYAQGSQIHLASGQEKHLPHEAWHTVQQKQGRVQPTTKVNGANVNDNAGLEKEADVMGSRALQMKRVENPSALKLTGAPSVYQQKRWANSLVQRKVGVASEVIQRLLVPFKTPNPQTANDAAIIADAGTINALTVAAYNNTWNRLVAATPAGGGVPLAIAQFPGVTAGHFGNFLNAMVNGNDAQKAMTTGYVIEDQVTFGGGLPGAAAAQVVVGNARPDFVITHGGVRGIVDVTSSGQQGHVLNKNFAHGGFRYIGEATYPSINFGALGGAPPVLGGAAAALAQNARHQQANRYFNRRLGQLRMQTQLLAGGVLRNNRRFRAAATMVRGRLAYIRATQNLTRADIRLGDQRIAMLNRTIPRQFAMLRFPSVLDILNDTQHRYMVAGTPHW